MINENQGFLNGYFIKFFRKNIYVVILRAHIQESHLQE